MKKLTALLVVIVGLMTVMFTGCSNRDTFTKKTYRSGENVIKSIVFQVTDRELEIAASEDEQIHIDYFDGEKEYLKITVSDNNELIVESESDKNWTDFVGVKPAAEYRKIQMKIPDHSILSCSVSTTNENISISSLSFIEGITLDVNGGNIVFNRIGVGSAIDLTAKNGNISGTVVGSSEDFSISCSIKKGDCNLPQNKEDGEKSLSANCNNGNIDIEFVG